MTCYCESYHFRGRPHATTVRLQFFAKTEKFCCVLALCLSTWQWHFQGLRMRIFENRFQSGGFWKCSSCVAGGQAKTELFDDTAPTLSNHLSFSMKLQAKIRPVKPPPRPQWQWIENLFLIVRRIMVVSQFVLFLWVGRNLLETSAAKVFSGCVWYKVMLNASNFRVGKFTSLGELCSPQMFCWCWKINDL